MTQTDIADALGLTPVHVNRMLQRMRRERLISLTKHELTILDAQGLRDAAGFDPAYLQILAELN